jgi:hypothetical protein
MAICFHMQRKIKNDVHINRIERVQINSWMISLLTYFDLFGLQSLIFRLHFIFIFKFLSSFLILIFVGVLRYPLTCPVAISFVVSCLFFFRSNLGLGVYSPLYNPMFFTYSTSIFAPSSLFSVLLLCFFQLPKDVF